MYRILPAVKTAYITDKYINNSQVTNANVGAAGTVNLYKCYNELHVSGAVAGFIPIERSRGLLKFDLNPLRQLTSSILNINNASFKAFVSLKNIYGGQTVPSNYSLALHPLAKSFDEGRGTDVIAYRDIDTVNWLTASVEGGVQTLWSVSGAYASGAIGETGIDYYVSGNFGGGSASLGVTQEFNRGDEDLLLDVTTTVSATLAGLLPDYGYRLAFIQSQENDTVTRFVKRFASRHVRDPFLRPALIVKYGDSTIDNQASAFFDVTNTVFAYNGYYSQYRNFFSGSNAVTGSNSLKLKLFTSKSYQFLTTSFSTTHSSSITYLTNSLLYFSATFTGSQYLIGSIPQTGIYSCSFSMSLDVNATPGIMNYMLTGVPNNRTLTMTPVWLSLDETVAYTTGSNITFQRIVGGSGNVSEQNIVTNVTNLKPFYKTGEMARMRVYTQNFDTELVAARLPTPRPSQIFNTMYWRLLKAFSREEVIPFETGSNSTRMSSDANGMYFDVYTADLPTNQVYDLEFLIRDNGQDNLITNQGFRFKVVP